MCVTVILFDCITSLAPFLFSHIKTCEYCALPIMSSMDSLEILNPNALIAFLSSRASIDLQVKHVCDY